MIKNRQVGLPRSFGVGTEVLPASTDIDLVDFLPNGEDVTAYYELLTLGIPRDEDP